MPHNSPYKRLLWITYIISQAFMLLALTNIITGIVLHIISARYLRRLKCMYINRACWLRQSFIIAPEAANLHHALKKSSAKNRSCSRIVIIHFVV